MEPNEREIPDAAPSALDTARIRAIYVVLVLIVAYSVTDLVSSGSIDLGVFATLMGGLLGLLGLGAVVRFVGMK